MLGKLLKYDLKWIFKLLIVFYCLALAFSVIAYGFSNAENSMLFSVLSKIAYSFAISMIVSSLINCIMRSWARFVKNIYKDESYLTHTLPVSRNTVYLSKVLSALICTFTTIILAAICLFICFYNEDGLIEQLKNLLSMAADIFNSTVFSFLFIIFCVVVLEVILILLIGYVGVIIGFSSNKYKMAKSIIIAFLMYIVTNILSVTVIYIAGLFDSGIMNLIKTNEALNVESLKTVMLLAIAIYVVLNVVYYFIGRSVLKKGVNVD